MTLVLERVRAAAAADDAGAGAVRVLDLGTGTGSNLRYLAPHLPMPQEWCLVDRDVELLRQLPKRVAAWALDRGAIVSGSGMGFIARGPAIQGRFDPRTADLARLADDALFGPLFERRALVTASALLDLVSERWLDTLVLRCRQALASVLFVLTYDGRLLCTPEDPDDEWIRALVNRHQRTAKGFGRALGPDATLSAAQRLRAAGYQVACAPSDWMLGPDDAALQRPLIEGWASAAAEMAGKERARAERWMERRLAHLDAGVSHLTVGHQDLAGWLDVDRTNGSPVR